MQRVYNKRIYLFLITLIFCSCELTKEIDYKTIGRTDWIVINGFISKEHGVNAIVKKTVPPNRVDDNDIIHNPDVWLYINKEAFARLIEIDQYHYFLPPDSIDFTPDALYSIHVNVEGMESAKSVKIQLIPKVEIDTVYVVYDSIEWRNERVFIEFDDDTEKENYYTIKINYFKNGEIIFNPEPNEILPKYTFTDEGYGMRIKKSYQLEYQDFDYIQARLFTVSENYPRFLSSYRDYNSSYEDYNYENQYIVETQIENGFGFFASYEVSNYIYKQSTH